MSDSNSAFPTVATIIGCPEELSTANGLVATPIGISGELCPPSIPNQQPIPPDTSNIKDPVAKAVVDNIWGKLPTKTPVDKDVFKCDLCKVECIGQTVFNTHLTGSKHNKRVKELEMQKEYASLPFMELSKESGIYTCTLCNATLNASSQIDAHMSGMRHKNKMQSKKQLVDDIAEINNDPKKPRVDATPNLLFCATCNIHVNSTMQLDQHTASRKHINRVNGVRMGKPRPGPYTTRRPGLGSRGLGRGGLGGGRYFSRKQQPPPPSSYSPPIGEGGFLPRLAPPAFPSY